MEKITNLETAHAETVTSETSSQEKELGNYHQQGHHRKRHIGLGHGLHHDPEWTGDDVDFSHIDGKKVLHKMDLRLLPVLTILYLMSFLDRGNIGNAKIEGMLDDLHMKGADYNWACKSEKIWIDCLFA